MSHLLVLVLVLVSRELVLVSVLALALLVLVLLQMVLTTKLFLLYYTITCWPPIDLENLFQQCPLTWWIFVSNPSTKYG